MALDGPGGAISHLDLEKRGQQVGGRLAIAIGGVGEVLPVAVDARQAQGLEQGRQYGGGLILGAGHQCTSPLAIRLLLLCRSGGGLETSRCDLHSEERREGEECGSTCYTPG